MRKNKKKKNIKKRFLMYFYGQRSIPLKDG